MSTPDEERKAAARLLASIGGKAGTGKAKKRGSSAHYRKLNAKSRAKRIENQKAAANGANQPN